MRGRRWALVINQSAPCFESVKETLLNDKNFCYALILHDKDIDEEGQPKKPHYHIVLDYTNPRAFSSIANRFEGAHIENIKSFNNAVQYLIHKNNPGKYQYNLEDITTNNIDWLTEAMNSDVIISNRFDFNKTLEYFKDFMALTEKDFNFIAYLIARFPLDSFQIISKQMKINDYVGLYEGVESAMKSIIKDNIF